MYEKEVKKGLFTNFCLGIGAIAIAPKAGEKIKEVVEYIKEKI